jgi:hypothetical protein
MPFQGFRSFDKSQQVALKFYQRLFHISRLDEEKLPMRVHEVHPSLREALVR